MTKEELKEIFPDLKVTLEHLAEEAAEVIQMKSKIFRFGLDDVWEGESNRTKLENELGHFLAVVDVLMAHEVVDRECVQAAKSEKFTSMRKWNAYRGTKGEL